MYGLGYERKRKVKCDIVICKKYIFGQSDEQNIFLTYIWS